MNNTQNIMTYDIYEIDLYDLKCKVEKLKINEVIVYGIGHNGFSVYTLFQNLGIKIKYFVDIKAETGVDTFKELPVISPREFITLYHEEIVVITPAMHKSIYQWMKENGIPEEKLLLSFYKTESIRIDYGNQYTSGPSSVISYCKQKPGNIKGTFFTIAYNTPENLLRRAIESVLRQTKKELKYLFIVNGATDNTLKIIKEYAALDARICIIEMKENLPWTDVRILSSVKDNLEGDYCCQLDSDDYYDETFLEETVTIGDRNNADIVGVRTCLFCADNEFDPMNDGLLYDWHDKLYFNIVHPPCHFIGHQQIMYAYARAKICSTFWGKLYANSLMKKYLNYIVTLPTKERELYYRLDIAMTYRILSMAERVFYSDKVLHFSQYSQKNSTFTLAPIEWLISLWYAYTNIKEEVDAYYKKGKAWKYTKEFLEVHLLWMVARKGMLKGSESWKYRDSVIGHFKEMSSDRLFKSILVNRKSKYMKKDCLEFYKTVKQLAEEHTI